MASLTGNNIQDTYEGLIKTSDNGNLGATSKVITDGEGNESGLSLDTNGNVGVENDLSVGGDITLSGALIDGNGTPGTAGQILASTVTGTDWISLSEIQGVDGTGTANKVSKWLDAETIADSSITDNGSLVSVANPLSVTGSVTATSLVKSGGLSSEFLKADGSVDSTVYATESDLTTAEGNIATNASNIATNTSDIATKVSKAGDTMTGNLTAPSFIKTGGTSSQFLKADGSVDSNTYATTSDINLSNTPSSVNVEVLISGGTDTTIASATTSLAGVMSASDKTKLDGIEAGADVTDDANVAAAGAMMTGVAVLNDLSNVSGTPSDGQVLAYDSVNGWQPANAAGGAVDSVNGQTGVVVLSTSDLDDVSATAPTDGQVLRYDNTLGVYVPETLSSTAPVDSVNGQTGAVVLDADDISDASTTNKYTTAADISKLAGIEAGAEVNTVDSVNSQTGVVVLDADDIDDSATTNKFTTAGDISKLAGIESGADVTDSTNVVSSLVGAVAISSGDKTTIQTNIDVDPAGTDNSVNVTLAGSYDYLTLVGQQITLNQIDYSTDISNTPTIPNAPAIENNAGTPQLATGITAGEVRTVIDVDVAGTDNSTPVTLSGSYDYLSLADQTITLNQVDLTTDVTGTLPIANGGTGSTTAAGSLANLGGDTKYTVSVISENTTAVKDFAYVLTANLTLTLPLTPSVGDKIKISNQSGTTTPTVSRNGENIQGLAEDLILDVDGFGLELIYSGATKGWVII